jgi:hypothetical protein
MAEEHKPTDADLENIKKAMVAAGILKATTLSHEEEARITKSLAQHGIDVEQRNWKLVCSWAHWCIVIPKKAT